jgi:hypothetical protein
MEEAAGATKARSGSRFSRGIAMLGIFAPEARGIAILGLSRDWSRLLRGSDPTYRTAEAPESVVPSPAAGVAPVAGLAGAGLAAGA